MFFSFYEIQKEVIFIYKLVFKDMKNIKCQKNN